MKSKREKNKETAKNELYVGMLISCNIGTVNNLTHSNKWAKSIRQLIVFLSLFFYLNCHFNVFGCDLIVSIYRFSCHHQLLHILKHSTHCLCAFSKMLIILCINGQSQLTVWKKDTYFLGSLLSAFQNHRFERLNLVLGCFIRETRNKKYFQKTNTHASVI